MRRSRSPIHDETLEPVSDHRATKPGPASALLDSPASTVDSLQRGYGNRAVERLVDADLTPVSRHTRPTTSILSATSSGPSSATSSAPEVDQTYETVTAYQLNATIRQSPEAAAATDGVGAQPPSPNKDLDAEDAGDDEVVTEEEEGSITIEESDSVNTAMTYTPTIANSPDPPGATDFGVTKTRPSVSGISVVHDAAALIFNVTASVTNTITWSVHSRGRTNIADKNANAITQDNYTDVAADLTPDMSSDNGRPPRANYWAEDLTTKHEKFHANERANTYGRPAFNFAQNWLANQTADDAAAATALARQVPGKMNESYAASYSPGKESRAYGDGAPSYQARADAILAKGAARGYALGETDLYQPGGETGVA